MIADVGTFVVANPDQGSQDNAAEGQDEVAAVESVGRLCYVVVRSH